MLGETRGFVVVSLHLGLEIEDVESVEPTTVFDEVNDDLFCCDVNVERLRVAELLDLSIIDDADKEGFGAAFGCFEEIVGCTRFSGNSLRGSLATNWFCQKYIKKMFILSYSGKSKYGQLQPRHISTKQCNDPLHKFIVVCRW